MFRLCHVCLSNPEREKALDLRKYSSPAFGGVLTSGELVKVDVEAEHEGAGDEAQGGADGGHGEEDAW